MTSYGQYSQDVLLSASTLSALSNSSSALEGIDLEVIEEIIERAPRSATTFPLVYRAYGIVLEEHDSKYYNFLLKLGVIRAPTWGEKWDLFQSTQAQAQAVDDSFAPSSGTASPRSVPYASAGDRKVADKSRIPFLASASSDLDEGFEPSSDGRQVDGASLIGYPRPSPRKVLRKHADRSRSLVGYTPSQSVDLAFDTLSLNPPIRTSTPVYAQQPVSHGHQTGRSSPGLPPYSVSDISQALDLSTSLMGDTEDPVTPRLQQKMALTPDIAEKWDTKTTSDMESLADNFYRLGLLGRCLDVWVQSHQWLRSTTSQIDRVRETILLRQTMEKWRAAYDLQLALPATADRHFKLSRERRTLSLWLERTRVKGLDRTLAGWVNQKDQMDVRNTWKRWRVEVVRRRTERWQKEVGKKERGFVKKKRQSLAAEMFEKWYGAMKDKVDGETADRFAAQRAQLQALQFWSKRTSLSRKLAEATKARDERHMANALDMWRVRSRLASVERSVEVRSHTALVRSTWEQWRAKQSLESKARAFEETRSVKLAMGRWIRKYRHTIYLEQRADTLHRVSSLRDTMHVWVTKERGELYGRVQGVRLLKKGFSAWQDRLSALKLIEDRGDILARVFEQATLHRQFSRWRAKLGDQNQLRLRAILHYESLERNDVTRAFATWRGALETITRNNLTAVKARAFFVQRQALRTWKISARLKAQADWVEKKRLEETKLWFDAWKARLELHRNDTLVLQNFWAGQNQHLVASVLSKWTRRVIEIKSLQHDVLKKRNVSLKRNALDRWLAAADRVKSAEMLMQSVIQVRTEDHFRKIFVTWRAEALRLKRLRDQAETSILQRQDKLLGDTFDRWREVHCERRLRGVEEEVGLRREDALMFAVWDTWKGKSKRLPEIAFTKKRLVKNAWAKWRQGMAMKDKERSISVPKEQQLLLDVFSIWKEATQRKVALNAIRRRGRVRPGAAPPRLGDGTRRVSADHARPRSSTPGSALNTRSHPIAYIGPTERAARRLTMDPSPALISARDGQRGEAESTTSEPAYSRLRSELYGRKRGGSEEPEDRRGSSSELVRQLRGALR